MNHRPLLALLQRAGVIRADQVPPPSTLPPRATLHVIAAFAGCSPPTVARFLRGAPVRADLAARIAQVCQRLQVPGHSKPPEGPPPAPPAPPAAA